VLTRPTTRTLGHSGLRCGHRLLDYGLLDFGSHLRLHWYSRCNRAGLNCEIFRPRVLARTTPRSLADDRLRHDSRLRSFGLDFRLNCHSRNNCAGLGGKILGTRMLTRPTTRALYFHGLSGLGLNWRLRSRYGRGHHLCLGLSRRLWSGNSLRYCLCLGRCRRHRDDLVLNGVVSRSCRSRRMRNLLDPAERFPHTERHALCGTNHKWGQISDGLYLLRLERLLLVLQRNHFADLRHHELHGSPHVLDV
jgi:hypothetical protein